MAIKSAVSMVGEAKTNIENLNPQQVSQEIKNDNTILIDLREANELTDQGKIPGSIHAPRGMLEFYADPSLPYHKQEFQPDKRIILHCASGGRSALAVQTLKQMGYENVAHMDGGIKAWKEQALPVE